MQRHIAAMWTITLLEKYPVHGFPPKYNMRCELEYLKELEIR